LNKYFRTCFSNFFCLGKNFRMYFFDFFPNLNKKNFEKCVLKFLYKGRKETRRVEREKSKCWELHPWPKHNPLYKCKRLVWNWWVWETSSN
jgi:hypothetical protein